MSLTNASNDVEPCNDSPQTVLLTDVVAAGTETLLTADAQLVVVEQSAEELPAGGNLVAVQTLSLGNQVDGARGGHATS